VLSNISADGKPIGLADAGQGWHTDMSYSTEIALANVLYAIRVPMRDGRPLGDTQFRNMHAAYDDLPAQIKRRLDGRTATHDFAKFWNMMRARPGSSRAPLTPQQRAKKPPVSQPIFRTHPITGRMVLYCNPGYTTHIDGMADAESAELLQFLFAHQEQEKYSHSHQWTEGDVLMWDNIGTVHNAVADYRPDEPRYMRRLQIMATKDYARLAAGSSRYCGLAGNPLAFARRRPSLGGSRGHLRSRSGQVLAIRPLRLRHKSRCNNTARRCPSRRKLRQVIVRTRHMSACASSRSPPSGRIANAPSIS